MSNRPETPIDVDTNPPAKAYDSVMVEPTFVLLFSVQMTGAFNGFLLIRTEHHPARSEHLQPSELERHVFGENFAAAGRTKRWPLGRIAMPHEGQDAGFPSQADVYLVTHTTGTAIWEAWLHGPSQPMDASRWIAWLDPDSEDGLPALLWRELAPHKRHNLRKP